MIMAKARNTIAATINNMNHSGSNDLRSSTGMLDTNPAGIIVSSINLATSLKMGRGYVPNEIMIILSWCELS